MNRVTSVILQDILQRKAIVGYFLLLAALGWGVFLVENQAQKAVLMLLQVVLLVQPLMTVLYTATYYYNSQEFIRLLLAQPIRRSHLIRSIFLGLFLAFLIAFLLAIGLPVLTYAPGEEGLFLILVGLLLIGIFTALALMVGVYVMDKTRGLGTALILWAFFAFVYDGLLLLGMYQFADYPIEKTVLGFSLLNPIDIGRILVIMKTEAAALLGLSGAIFRKFFGSNIGAIISLAALVAWVVIPFLLMQRRFLRKDL